MSVLKKTGISAAVTGAAMLFAGAAHADCSVTDYDKKGFLGLGNKTHSREFAGKSVTKIWNDYCKPYIEKTIAKENIQNGQFGMHCTGSLSCDIKGSIVNGQPQPLKLTKGL